MPDALEFPGVRRAVVPLVSAGIPFVDEFIAFTGGHTAGRFLHSTTGGLPGFSAVAGALNDLAEPTAGLRSVDPIRIGRGAFNVINLPAGKVRPGDGPFLPLAVGGEDECPFACSDKDSYLTHRLLLRNIRSDSCPFLARSPRTIKQQVHGDDRNLRCALMRFRPACLGKS